MAIHVFKAHWGGAYEVWSDPEPGHHQTGRCIGTADTFEQAMEEARSSLREDLDELSVKTPADAIEE